MELVIGQSEPWDEEQTCSHVWTNRKEPFLGIRKECRDRRVREKVVLLRDQKEKQEQ
jgi:hypothetical protein